MTGIILFSMLACAKQKYKNLTPPTPAEVFQAYQEKTDPSGQGSGDLRNIHMKGTMKMPMVGDAIPLDSWVIKDQGLTLSMSLPDIGDFEQGYNFEYGWMINPMEGPRLMTEAEKIQAGIQYESSFVDSFADLYREPKVVGLKEIREEMTWQVDAIDKSDKPVSLFFALDTKLLVAQYGVSVQGKGELKTKTYFRDYQEIDGTLMYKTMETKTLGLTQTLTFDVIETNVENPPAIEIPEAVMVFITPESTEGAEQSESAAEEPAEASESTEGEERSGDAVEESSEAEEDAEDTETAQ